MTLTPTQTNPSAQTPSTAEKSKASLSNRFTFTFRGELHPSKTIESASENLAIMFQCGKDAFHPIFKGDAVFERTGLDKLTAQAYEARFSKVGALGSITETPKQNTQHEPENPERSLKIEDITHCPKCRSADLANGQCNNCGVFLHKVLPQLKDKTHSTPIQHVFNSNNGMDKGLKDNQATTIHHEHLDRSKNHTSDIASTSSENTDALPTNLQHSKDLTHKNTSQRWLTISSIAIIAIIIGDQSLQNFHTLEFAGVDIGIIPLLIAHTFLLYGCFLFTKEQKLKLPFGFLGLFSIAGLAILSVIANKINGRSIGLKQLAFVIFSVGVVYHWSTSWSFSFGTEYAQIMNTAHLASGRSEYPSTTLQDSPEIYEAEEQEMLHYLQTSLETLSTKKIRPNQMEHIADTLFTELTRYQAWRNYQYFLHARIGKALPDSFSIEKKSEHNQRIKRLINAHIDPYTSHPRLARTYQAWTISALPDNIPSAAWGIPNKIRDMFDRFRFSADDKTPRNTTIEAMNNIDLSNLLPPSSPSYTVSSVGNTITFQFNEAPLNTTPLVVAFYWEEVERRPRRKSKALNRDDISKISTTVRSNTQRRNTRYRAKIALVSPSFPYKYITGGYLKILEEYEFNY